MGQDLHEPMMMHFTDAYVSPDLNELMIEKK